MKISNRCVINYAAGFSLALTPLIQGQDDEEDVFELSPFTVESGDTQGYRANSTLAGSRLKTQLSDLGQSISVLTEEFFEDTGATDAATALGYVMSAEVGGEQGNFSNASPGTAAQNSTDTTSARLDPQAAQRIRGLSPAELTRGYFQTDIPLDKYNTSQVTISRGPNSLLFGIGSPGGVIDNSPSSASTGRDFGNVTMRLGERASHRLSFDINRVLIDDRLGIRISALNEETNYKQEPAFEKDRRFYLAFNAVLLKNENTEIFGPTVLRGNYEKGSIDRNPEDVIPIGNALKDWYELPNPEIFDIVGIENPGTFDNGSMSYVENLHPDGPFQPKWGGDIRRPEAYPRAWRTLPGSGRPAFFTDITLFFQPDGTPGLGITGPNSMYQPVENNIIHGTQGRAELRAGEFGRVGGKPRNEFFISKAFEAETYSTGFAIPSLIDRNVFDNMNNLLTGDTNYVNSDFKAHNFTLEQTLFNNKAGFEIAFDDQEFDRRSHLTMTKNRHKTIAIDVNKAISDNQVNPNFGRPIIVQNNHSGGEWGDEGRKETHRQTFRATAFYDLDFTNNDGPAKWLGRHVFSGATSERTIDTWEDQLQGKFVVPSGENEYWANVFGGKNCNNPDFPGNICQKDAFTLQYLAEPQLDTNSWRDIRLATHINIPEFQEGLVFNDMLWDNKNNVWIAAPFQTWQKYNGGSYNITEFESETYTWQSYLFNGHIVGLAGWRKDTQSDFSIGSGTYRFAETVSDKQPDGRAENLQGHRIDPRLLTPEENELFEPTVNTATWSVVGHLPFQLPGKSRLSFHYSEAENFKPTQLRRTARGTPAPSPQGTTKEYGFSLNLLEQKVHIKANWFETANKFQVAANGGTLGVIRGAYNEHVDVYMRNFDDADDNDVSIEQLLTPNTQDCPNCIQDAGDFTQFFSSWDEVFAGIRGLIPSDMAAAADIQIDPATMKMEFENPDFNNLKSFQDQVAEGFELELVINPNSNWRIGGNLTKLEAVTSNSAAVHGAVLDEIKANIDNSPFKDMRDRPRSTTGFTFASTFFRSSYLPMLNVRAKDGTVNTELVKWRGNFFTNYTFSEDSRFKGFAVGGAIRWSDEVAAGYALNPDLTSDTSRPFFGDASLQGDVFMSYKKKLSDKLTWKSQLNIRNAIGENDFIPVKINPDGSLAVFRNPPPTDVFWTNTFSF